MCLSFRKNLSIRKNFAPASTILFYISESG